MKYREYSKQQEILQLQVYRTEGNAGNLIKLTHWKAQYIRKLTWKISCKAKMLNCRTL